MIVSQDILNRNKTKIVDIEVIFNSNSEIPIANTITISLRRKIPIVQQSHTTQKLNWNI